jgi:putative thioredoxin
MQTAAILDVTVETFQKEVVERSRRTPVLIDFWATWCGPCKTLGPVLEKLAREFAGSFTLAKIDIDRNQELAEVFQIQSVPTVLLLKDGRLADGFAGALPEVQIRKFLELHLGLKKADPLEEAAKLEAEGKRTEALALLATHLNTAPGDAKARLMAARLCAAEGRLDDARAHFDKVVGEAREGEEAKALAAQLEAASQSAGATAALEAAVKANPKDVAARLAYGKALVAASKHAEGLEQMLEAARLDLAFEDGAPRKALIEVFNLLGWSDPLVLDYQRRLSMLLCV